MRTASFLPLQWCYELLPRCKLFIASKSPVLGRPSTPKSQDHGGSGHAESVQAGAVVIRTSKYPKVELNLELILTLLGVVLYFRRLYALWLILATCAQI